MTPEEVNSVVGADPDAFCATIAGHSFQVVGALTQVHIALYRKAAEINRQRALAATDPNHVTRFQSMSKVMDILADTSTKLMEVDRETILQQQALKGEGGNFKS